MKEEIWRPIKDYDGLYEVSNLGRVRSVERIETLSDGRKHLHKGKILKPAKGTGGYLICKLYKNSKHKTITVHRLVAKAFIPNPDNLPQVNHRDENKRNNCVSNLEWCSCKYNINYGTGIQRSTEKRSKSVLQLDINTGRVIYEYPSLMEVVRKLNISQSRISDCCRGKRKTAYGYKWKYKKE